MVACDTFLRPTSTLGQADICTVRSRVRVHCSIGPLDQTGSFMVVGGGGGSSYSCRRACTGSWSTLPHQDRTVPGNAHPQDGKNATINSESYSMHDIDSHNDPKNVI